MIAHLIFWLAVRCAPRRVVDLQRRQRRAHSIVAGVMQFDFAAFSRHYNSGSALCGKTTRDYTFITADFPYCGMSPPPALLRLWRRLNCFWLIKAINITQLPASPAPTAYRLLSMSRIASFAAHPTPTSYMRLYRFVYNAALRASVFCLIAPKYGRLAPGRK
jgi:hypothetical protein